MIVNDYVKMTTSLNILINLFQRLTNNLELQIFFEPDELSIYIKNYKFLLDLGIDKSGNYFYYYIDEEQELFADDKDVNLFSEDEVFSKILHNGLK